MEAGYERVTVRAVAAKAGVDAALVMQHFKGKAGLFAVAAQWGAGSATEPPQDLRDVPFAALKDLFARFEGAEGNPNGPLDLLRSCTPALRNAGATRSLGTPVRLATCRRSSCSAVYRWTIWALMSSSRSGAGLVGRSPSRRTAAATSEGEQPTWPAISR